MQANIITFLMATRDPKRKLPIDLLVHIAKLAYGYIDKETLIQSLRHELLLHQWTPIRPIDHIIDEDEYWRNAFHEELERLCELLQTKPLSRVKLHVGWELPECKRVNDGTMSPGTCAHRLSMSNFSLTIS